MIKLSSRLVVFVPVYNEGHYIEEALVSLISQTYQDFLVLISDNASTDDTEEICRRVIANDSRFNYVRQSENIGAANNFKYCLDHSDSEFVMWLGGHDWIAPDFLELTVARMLEDDSISLVYGHTRWIDEEGTAIAEYNGGDYIFDEPLNSDERYLKLLLALDRCEAVNQLIRREFVDLDLRSVFSGDVILLCHLAAHGKFSRVEKPIYMRREFLRGRSTTAMERVSGKLEVPRYHQMAAYFVESICGHSSIPGSRRNNLIQDVLLWMDRKYSIFSGVDTTHNAYALQSAHISKGIPFFSVVMPVYNREIYIGSAISSILSQGFDNFELIISDDGSVDRSLDIAAEFGDSRIRIVRGSHAGGASARNRGLATARGQFVVWIDSDDIQEPGALATLRKAIEDCPDGDVFYGDLIIFDDADLKNISRTNYPDYFGTDMVPLLILGNRLPNPGTAVRRALYDQFGNYNTGFRRCHDYQMWSRLADTAKFKKVPAFLCRWRQHGASLSSTKSKYFESKVVLSMFHQYPASRLFPDIKEDERGAAYSRVSQIIESLQEYGLAARMASEAQIEGVVETDRIWGLMHKSNSSYIPSIACVIRSSGDLIKLKRVLDDLESQAFQDFFVYVVSSYNSDIEILAQKGNLVIETVFHDSACDNIAQDRLIHSLLDQFRVVDIDENSRYHTNYLADIYRGVSSGISSVKHLQYVY